MASTDEIYAKLNAEIISLAREWVIEHLVKTDAKMAVFLRKYLEDLS